ncbi:MAG TPA: amino acid permease [Flexilinea sp.]|nr:amino acid permease [Flexilinea sp.]
MDEKQRLEALTSEKTEFRREIGVFGGVSIIGGIMIGSGIFYLGSYVLIRTGMSQGLSLLAWVLGGLISLLGGLCFAELGASIPRAGGMTVYLNEAFHPLIGFLNAFSGLLIGSPGSIAAIAIALPTAMRTFFPISDSGIKIIAILLIVGLTVFNYFGIRPGSQLQSASMIAKLIPIGIILFASLFLGKVSPDLSMVPEAGPVGFGKLVSMVAFAVIATLWAYEGWTNLNNVTEEVKNPRRNLPLALIIAIGGITVLYTLFNYGIYRVLPFDQIKAFIESGNYYLGTEAAKPTLGNAGAVVVTVAMVLSMFGSLNGCILAFPRTYYAMAEEGHFFHAFAELHPKYKVPATGLIVQCIISVVLVLVRNLDQLTSLVIFTSVLYNMLTVLAVIRLRKKYPDIPRPFKIWGYPFTVILTALIFLGLVINTFIEDPVSAITGMVIPVIGTVVYFLFDRYRKKEAAAAAQKN